jgi:WD40 repeat protein
VSGSLSGEVKVWAVPEGTCVGSYQAHRGSTSALTFLDQGNKLLSAGADHTVGPHARISLTHSLTKRARTDSTDSLAHKTCTHA